MASAAEGITDGLRRTRQMMIQVSEMISGPPVFQLWNTCFSVHGRRAYGARHVIFAWNRLFLVKTAIFTPFTMVTLCVCYAWLVCIYFCYSSESLKPRS